MRVEVGPHLEGIVIPPKFWPPLVTVLDQSGAQVWQQEGVTRWDAVPCGT
jgi:hypothetical protein